MTLPFIIINNVIARSAATWQSPDNNCPYAQMNKTEEPSVYMTDGFAVMEARLVLS